MDNEELSRWLLIREELTHTKPRRTSRPTKSLLKKAARKSLIDSTFYPNLVQRFYPTPTSTPARVPHLNFQYEGQDLAESSSKSVSPFPLSSYRRRELLPRAGPSSEIIELSDSDSNLERSGGKHAEAAQYATPFWIVAWMKVYLDALTLLTCF